LNGYPTRIATWPKGDQRSKFRDMGFARTKRTLGEVASRGKFSSSKFSCKAPVPTTHYTSLENTKTMTVSGPGVSQKKVRKKTTRVGQTRGGGGNKGVSPVGGRERVDFKCSKSSPLGIENEDSRFQ